MSCALRTDAFVSALLSCCAALDIVVVTWNSGADLLSCLPAAAACLEALPGTLTIVDNASRTDPEQLVARLAPGALLLANPTNQGFAAAANHGARHGSASAILFLNPDVVVSLPALRTALAALAAREDVGIVGLRFIDEAGRPMISAARLPTLARVVLAAFGLDRVLPALVRPHFLTPAELAVSKPVEQISGAFLLIRREIFKRLGGFDEHFFLYHEDADLCRRAAAAGALCWHAAEAAVLHRGGGSTRAVPAERLFLLAASRVQYFRKHAGAAQAAAVAFAFLAIEIPVRLFAKLGWSGGKALCAGFWLMANLPSLLRPQGRIRWPIPR